MVVYEPKTRECEPEIGFIQHLYTIFSAINLQLYRNFQPAMFDHQGYHFGGLGLLLCFLGIWYDFDIVIRCNYTYTISIYYPQAIMILIFFSS